MIRALVVGGLWLGLAAGALRAVPLTVAHLWGGASGAGPLPADAPLLALWLCAGTLAWVAASRGLWTLSALLHDGWLEATARTPRDGAWVGVCASGAGALALVGGEGLLAALAVAGTVPAVFFVGRRWFGGGGARLAALLVATSPAVLGGPIGLGAALAGLLVAWSIWALEARVAPRGASTLVAHAAVGLAVGALAALVEGWPLGGRPAAWSVVVVPGAAALRLGADALAWPLAAAVVLAGRHRVAAVGGALALGLLPWCVAAEDLGSAAFGAQRLHALVVPLALAAVAGLREARSWNPAPAWGRALAAMVAAAVLVASVGTVPARRAVLATPPTDAPGPPDAAP